jgi:hypothetical protein
MSTRGPQRWCPNCRGQIYFHHNTAEDGDVWYCQGCGLEIPELKSLSSLEAIAIAISGRADNPRSTKERK